MSPFFAEVRWIFGVEMARIRFQGLGEAPQAFLTLIRTHQLLIRVFPIFTPGGSPVLMLVFNRETTYLAISRFCGPLKPLSARWNISIFPEKPG